MIKLSSLQIPDPSSESQPRIPEAEGEADLDSAPVPESPEGPEDEAARGGRGSRLAPELRGWWQSVSVSLPRVRQEEVSHGCSFQQSEEIQIVCLPRFVQKFPFSGNWPLPDGGDFTRASVPMWPLHRIHSSSLGSESKFYCMTYLKTSMSHFQHDNDHLIKSLLRFTCDINRQSNGGQGQWENDSGNNTIFLSGYTPLHLAAINKSQKVYPPTL